MVRKARWWPALALGAIGGLTALVAFGDGRMGSQTTAPLLAGRPECPHDWDFKSNQMPIVGKNIDIPEFHDCQRFIEAQGGEFRYGALYAIFAADTLRELDSIVPGTSLASAEIYAEGDYSYLGIRAGYNCLYVARSARSSRTPFTAKMVPVSSPDVNCATLNPATASGTTLTVNETRVPGLTWSDYPPVARWDWSRRIQKQYIGIKCGTAWCEVGSRDLPPTATQANTLTGSKLRRARLIKGWYDEQFIAMRDPNGNTVPSQVWATIYPDSALDDMTSVSAFDARWVTVAHITFEAETGDPAAGQYKRSMNFDVVPAAAAMHPEVRLNTISLCHGRQTACPGATAAPRCDGDGQWWSRLQAANGGPSLFRCVVRRGHEHLASSMPGYRIPGTARWRWLASDEGTWQACVRGCCETGAS